MTRITRIAAGADLQDLQDFVSAASRRTRRPDGTYYNGELRELYEATQADFQRITRIAAGVDLQDLQDFASAASGRYSVAPTGLVWGGSHRYRGLAPTATIWRPYGARVRPCEGAFGY